MAFKARSKVQHLRNSSADNHSVHVWCCTTDRTSNLKKKHMSTVKLFDAEDAIAFSPKSDMSVYRCLFNKYKGRGMLPYKYRH